MTGPTRRAFQAEMTLKYCQGNPLQAETVCGWGRHTVALGLSESRTGPHVSRAPKRPSAAASAGQINIPRSLQPSANSPTPMRSKIRPFVLPLASTRLTAHAALAALGAQGYSEEQLPAPSTMAAVLNRLGFRLRKVLKAKPQKKLGATDAIFDHLAKKTRQWSTSDTVTRLSLDGTATVHIGEVSRGGLTRGDYKACDHDLGLKSAVRSLRDRGRSARAVAHHLWQLRQDQ